jgi:hypothetical protein
MPQVIVEGLEDPFEAEVEAFALSQ